MHKLLERQIKKLQRANEQGELALNELLELVSTTYEEIDNERRLRTRAIQLMSDELLDSNKKISERNELFLSAILQNIIDGVITLSSDGQVQYMNHSAKRIFGREVSEELDIRTLFPEESLQEVESIISPKAEGTMKNAELMGLHSSGVKVPLEMSVSPMDLDETVRYIVILRDISERKEVERQLVLSKEKAEEATHAKARFLSTMSHEIRTPLNAVIGAVNLMLGEKPREDQVQYLDILKFSSDNLLALINDILDFSKIEEGKIAIEKIELNVDSVLGKIYDANKFVARRKGIDLVVDHDHNIPEKLIGDPYRITQILNNLVANALKFTDFGSVNLSTKCLDITTDSALVRFLVSDTGIGIKSGEVERIFESFSQASTDTARKYGGTGLGLAISKQLVELMGGTIKVESSDKGTRFLFELQFDAEVLDIDAIATPLVNDGQQELNGARVLVVEDNRVNRFVVTRFLKKWKVDVDLADSGEDGVRKAGANDYDLILMDLQMPGIDGIEATRLIRAIDNPARSIVPIVALTASAMMESKKRVLSAGMDGFLAKPFSPDELKNVIISCLTTTGE